MSTQNYYNYLTLDNKMTNKQTALKKRQHLQQIQLGKLEGHHQENRVRPVFITLKKNRFKWLK